MRLAVDLGGTHLRCALADDAGRLLRQSSAPTATGPDAVAEQICAGLRALPGWERADALGVGAPGGVDPGGETLCLCSNLPGLDGYPLRRTLAQRLGLPVTLVNDADAACLGESLLGSGRGYASCCYLTVSTGIGGGYCRGGNLWQGAHGAAGEFGSVIVFPGRPAVGALPAGACESHISGSALLRRAREITGRDYAHAGEILADASPALSPLREDFVAGLARLLSILACVLDPACFILGGGCMGSWPLVAEELRARYAASVAAAYRNIPLLRASLPEPGLSGAALCCRRA